MRAIRFFVGPFERFFVLGVALMLLLSAGPSHVAAQDDLGDAVHEQLMGQVDAVLAERLANYETIKTPEQITAYQKAMRDHYLKQLGPMPERTPLRAKTFKKFQREGYTVEQVVFESQPNHFVTALFYLPEGEGPFPGVLIPCGHSADAKGYDGYQRASALMALNGMAALCYDPIDQGERMQRLDKNGKPIDQGTRAHGRLGVGSILLGRNTATFRVWDGFRAMDYLASRPEVDATKLGCTGNSGGGTMTSLLMAADERIACAAPSCYITSYDRLLHTIGPQDSEQHFFDQIGAGFDHVEFVTIRAPKPTLLLTATRDFFDINGSWDSFRQAKRLYTRMGYGDRVELLETDEQHGFTVRLREGAARWMSRWLKGDDREIFEPEIDVLTKDEFTITPEGQVMRLDAAVSTYDLNRQFLAGLKSQREKLWQGDADAALSEVRRISGIRPIEDLSSLAAKVIDETELDTGVTCRRLVLQSEGGVPMPAELFTPKNAGGVVCLYVHEDGKAAAREAVLERVKNGETVLAVDIRGVGETAPEASGYANFLGPEWRDVTIAYMLGSSYLAMRAEDVLAASRWLEANVKDASTLELHAVGRLGPAALHASALEPDLFDRVTLERSLQDWVSVVELPEGDFQYVNTVHGALTAYDLPDLARTLGGKITLIEPVDAMGKPVAP